MKVEPLIDALEADPFVPFVIVTADGRSLKVSNPHSVAVMGDKRTIFVAKSGKPGHVFLDLMLISAIDVSEPPTRHRRSRNGH